MILFEILKNRISGMTVEEFANWYLKEQIPYCSICENKDSSGVCLHTDCTQYLIKYLNQENLTATPKSSIIEIPQLEEIKKAEKEVTDDSGTL